MGTSSRASGESACVGRAARVAKGSAQNFGVMHVQVSAAAWLWRCE